MRRHEMVEKLARFIKNDEGGTSYMQFADDILDFLEENGMKPPISKTCPVLLTTKHTWKEEENELRNSR